MTKEFTISINGVTQSVDAVNALLARLNALDDRIDSLSDVDTGNLKRNLQDIRKELEDNADNWENIAERIDDVNTEVNRLERAYKSLDNPLKEQDIKDYNKQLKSVGKSLKDIEDVDINVDSTDVSRASAQAADLATNLKRVEDQLGNKININIGGLSLEFDDVNQAIGILEDKLYQLATSGQRNSQQFKDITAQIVNLRSAVRQVDNELDNAFSGGLNKAIQGVQGLTAIGSISQGIGGLFGVEEIDESIQKFAQLSLVLNGLKEVQEQLRDSTSFVAKAFGVLNNVASGTVNWLGKITGLDALSDKFQKLSKSFQIQGIQYQLESLTKYVWADTQEALDTLENKLKDIFGDDYEIPKGIKDMLKYFGDTNRLLSDLKDDFDLGIINEDQFNGAAEAIKRFGEEIAKETKQAGELRKEYFKLMEGFRFFIDFNPDEQVPKLTRFQKGLIGVANAAKVVGTAFKSLLKSTIILGLIQTAIEAISWAWDKLVGGFKSLVGWDLKEQVNAFDSMEQSIEVTNNAITKYKQNLQKLVDTKVISNQTRLNDTIAEYNRQLVLAVQNLQNLKKGQSLDLDSNNTWFSGADIQNLEDFTKQFEILQKAVQNGTDRFKALEGETEEVKKKFGDNWFREIWNTAGDAASDYAAAQKAVIGDIQYRINNLDLSKGEEEVKKFIELLDTPIYQISLANIENLFPEDEYAKVLSANINQIRDYYNEIKNLQTEAEVEAQKLQDQITDNNIAAIQNRFNRERAELENNYQRELRDAADNEELKTSITNKYNTQRNALLKSQANEARNIQNQINANEIAAMQDGLEKRLAELENSRQQELDSARDSEIKVGEQIAAINKKYDAQILEVKTEFYENRKKLLEDYSEQYRQLWSQIAQTEYDIAESRISNRYADRARELGYTEDSINNIRAYYEEIRDIANEEAKKLSEIDVERANHDKEDSLAAEKKRNKDRLESIEQSYRDGILAKEDYDKAIQDENDVHYKMMDTITREGEQRLVDIQKDYDEIIRNNNATAINEIINTLREAYDNIDSEQVITSIGVIDYNATKRSLEQAKEQYKELFKYIKEEYANLQKSLNEGKISFGDFTQAKKELDKLSEDTKKAQVENKNSLDTLLTDTIESVTNLVGSYIGVLGGMWSTYNDIQMMRFEQEQARLEGEYDMLEEAYEKQEELTQKHTDKLNDIEEELKTSRGDRRAHLVEQLNAERAAMLASLEEEQKIEKEKEINQKKQDALEKKRREQEKKNSIVQATINTFTAVTNALAVQPWFVGLALSAVALALGMAQVANIKKQKYASGGLLKGKSHNQGGIPVGQTGIEVEGNEYIVNKKSTAKNLPLIDYINTQNRTLSKDDLMKWFDSGKRNVANQIKNKYATGGIIPEIPNQNNEQTIVIQDDRPIVAEIVDIVNRADNYRQIQILSGLS